MRFIALILICFTAGYGAEITLVYPTKAAFDTNGNHELVPTKVKVKQKSIYTVIVNLLKHRGAKSHLHSFPFNKQYISFSSPGKGAKNLIEYYKGYSVKDNILRIDFDSEALRYFNNTPGATGPIAASILQTIKANFPHIKDFAYYIDGAEIGEGDA